MIIINDIINNVILINLFSVDDLNNNLKKYANENTLNKLNKICEKIKYPITMILEKHYVDKVFRDTYYNYFSDKHFEISRNCIRVSLFKNIHELQEFFEVDNNIILNKDYVGSIVIKPLTIGQIGRTYLDPNKMNISDAYIRTTKFNTIILGLNLTINAFPFSEQDSETMTCAETTIWGILEYYGTRYPEYRTILPHEITNCVDSLSNERVLPSYGLDFLTVSNVLKCFGFQPKVYAVNSFSDKNNFKNIFHYYVESGIPFAVGTNINNTSGHSTICIGHGETNYQIKKDKLKKLNH